jgi:hypothetical protein
MQNTIEIEDDVRDEINRHCIGNEAYKGYRCMWCGDGAVMFRGPTGDEARGHNKSWHGWLAPAWLVVKAEIDRRVAEKG